MQLTIHVMQRPHNLVLNCLLVPEYITLNTDPNYINTASVKFSTILKLVASALAAKYDSIVYRNILDQELHVCERLVMT
jgi:hypothetical protein